jgi:hypothetical protein
MVPDASLPISVWGIASAIPVRYYTSPTLGNALLCHQRHGVLLRRKMLREKAELHSLVSPHPLLEILTTLPVV